MSDELTVEAPGPDAPEGNLLKVAPWVAAVAALLVVTLVILVAFGTYVNHQQGQTIIGLQKENHAQGVANHKLLIDQEGLDVKVNGDTAAIRAFGAYEVNYNVWLSKSFLALCNVQYQVCADPPPAPPVFPPAS